MSEEFKLGDRVVLLCQIYASRSWHDLMSLHIDFDTFEVLSGRVGTVIGCPPENAVVVSFDGGEAFSLINHVHLELTVTQRLVNEVLHASY